MLRNLFKFIFKDDLVFCFDMVAYHDFQMQIVSTICIPLTEPFPTVSPPPLLILRVDKGIMLPLSLQFIAAGENAT